MKLALIPPVSLLSTTLQTHYQLMLPQLTGNSLYSSRYRSHCDKADSYVILDNGAAEGIEPNTRDLLDIAHKYKVSEIVIPDVIGDAKETIGRAMDFYHEAVPDRSIRQMPFNLMFVVQGQTHMEVLQSARWAIGQWWIDTLGIPRHLLTTLGDHKARIRIANMLSESEACKPIHFLGGNPSYPMEIASLVSPFHVKQKFIRGMDTSMPFTYAFANRKLDEQRPGDVGVTRPTNYFERKQSEFAQEVMQYNIDLLRKHAEDTW